MTKTITSANSKLTISAEGLYAGVQVQGFASDTAFTVESVQTAETRMGVDGNMSAGYTPHVVPQTIQLPIPIPSRCLTRSISTASHRKKSCG